ncbi:type VII secretion protein EccE [Streptomyces sp. SP17BM10]|uniref:type VII secretion protein EccE n=1 Tax=Streptomyces sp. SP17BM10 TaxID=3002530 RepID=UPI002E75FC2D|nr:type VII secretion protein EccE [Streptomyces sp. SP17BM10]MEE1785549.1 type VII secretion protein EccE [Streptomyces sp. SP17BM10]
MPSQTAPGRRGTAPGGRPPAAVRVHPPSALPGGRRTIRHLVLVEAALALAAIGWTLGRTATAVLGALGLALVLAGLVPLRGRTLPELLLARSALTSRLKVASSTLPPADADPTLAPVLELEPALRTYTHATEADFGGRTVRRETGMAGDGTFLGSVLLVQSRDRPLRPARGDRPLPLDVLGSALKVDDITLESVQVVQFTQPAPAPHLPEESLAARAHRELPGGSTTPGLRLTWVALKLDPERAAAAVRARGGGEEGARRALQRVTDQLAGRLEGAGFRATVLDERELIAALATAACANPLAAAGLRGSGGTGATRRTREGRRHWRIDDRWHCTYWISRWPRFGHPGGPSLPELVDLLTGAPAPAGTLSLALGHGGGSVTLAGHLRVTGRNEGELATTCREVESRAREAGLGLSRLDLEQAPGVLATLPLGGTA